MICPAAIRFEIPIVAIEKMSHVSVQEIEIGASIMKVGMNIVLLSAGRPFAVIEQVHHPRRIGHGADSDRVILFACFIDMFIHTIME